ncbi:MAG: hypothetical protein C5S45_08005 [Candidatus Methanocomedens sp.]|nr:MAG: hypothetical protein C5S45_08005 [ANME-2 cluster archaeon]
MTDSGELFYFYSYFSVNIFDIMHSFPLFFVRFALAGRIVGGDCYTGPGHKLLGIDGGRGCGLCGRRAKIAI